MPDEAEIVPLDPRSVANLILAEAKERQISLTNLALQKIIYFVHGKFLVEEGEPLVAGSFEAWQYGPVNLAVYDAFKNCGADPICQRATKRDLRTGKVEEVQFPESANLQRKITDAAAPYLKLSAGRLVDLSHASGSPWDRVTTGKGGQRSYGLRISNENIRENFKYHKISINDTPRIGEPDEESAPY